MISDTGGFIGRYMLCSMEQFLGEKDEDDIPTRFLSKSGFLPGSYHHMRFMGQWIQDLIVLDIRTHEIMGLLQQEAPLEKDPMAPPIFQWIRVFIKEPDLGVRISWKREKYEISVANANRDSKSISEGVLDQGGSEGGGATDNRNVGGGLEQGIRYVQGPSGGSASGTTTTGEQPGSGPPPDAP